ncbi:MAG: putative spermidine syntase [Candidatus Desulfovibrio kirbyi]|uniref:Putative spermidine syntase n=1 Tax=Candidatus Desulfovibrio kirbyi TaxID=2696086 RepID=A0A6L2R6U6_9BACT|nr:MAG: putative spermidine syntase [Candidatus Desulfovibrio kirbyi]
MLEFVVCVAGALVMVLEMTGARLMAPHVGTSVIVWTSLIGVMMAFLALGAWLGGRLADRRLSLGILARILLCAGLGAAVTVFLHHTFGARLMKACPNVYVGAVIGAAVYFALPTFFFGMIPPYIVRLRLSDMSRAGADVGRLYALSTAGSIVGTFLGGFVLISFFAGTQILLGIAATTGLLSLIVAAGKKDRAKNAALVLVFYALSFAVGNGCYNIWREGREGFLPTLETPYNTIRLYESKDACNRRVRIVQTDPGKIQSGMYVDDPVALFAEYTRYYAISTALAPKTRRVLMLGGGGYSVPRWLLAGRRNLKDFQLDVVEIDPGMTHLAKKYFHLTEDPRMVITHEDARRFLNSNEKKYSLIFVDVFNSYYTVPFQMGTVEAALAMRRALAPDGILLMNVISAFSGEDGRLYRAIHSAMAQVFPEIHTFAVDMLEPLGAVQNLILLALPKKRPDLAAAFNGNAPDMPEDIRNMLRTRILAPVARDVPPLTDDFAPVERYSRTFARY